MCECDAVLCIGQQQISEVKKAKEEAERQLAELRASLEASAAQLRCIAHTWSQ